MTTDAKELLARYEAHTPRSRELTAEARRWLPGGDTRASAHYKPYPAFVERGEGCRIFDVDGHEYVDFMNNFTSLIHGHAHPDVVAAIAGQAARGSAYAAPTLSQVELARMLCERIPSVEELRFTSSGSEATLMCLRAARAWTGRQRVMKMEGGYHGSYDLAEVSLVPMPELCGPPERPVPVPVDRSIAASALEDAVVAPYNHPERAVELIEAHASELAALIVEPVQASMGMVPATREFLIALREACARHRIAFVLDEVVTLRLAPGGAQELLGLDPDLTAMGKIIGGGLPIGAFGGRRDVLELFNPERRDSVMHASTFSGNPLSMAAGIATFRALEAGDYERLNRLGERLRAGFDDAFRKAGLRGRAIGSGSLSQISFTDGPVSGPRDALDTMLRAGRIARLLHLGMLRRGIFGAGRLMYCTSTPMAEAEIERAIAALLDALEELRPVVERERPELIR